MASPPSHPKDENGIDQSLDEIMIDGKDPNSRSNEICRDFQRGYCARGERCYFRHVAPDHSENELGAPGILTTLGGRPLCRDYIRGHCRRGVECPFFHIQGGERCRDFERMQECRRGILCPFLHVSLQPRGAMGEAVGSPPGVVPLGVKPMFGEKEQRGAQGYDPTAMAMVAQYRGEERRHFEAPVGVPRPVGGGGGVGVSLPKQNFVGGEFRPPIVKTELCRDWARFNGECPRGISCQYLHGKPGDICRDFTRRGQCYRGERCPFAHHIPVDHQPEACRKFLRGECERANCRYFHPPPPPFSGEENSPHSYPAAEFS